MEIGGVVKMSIIASERIKRGDGLQWQPSEEEEQATVMEWATLMRNQRPELDLLHHIPNGEYRHPAVAKRLKRLGVKAGVPDLFLPVARGGAHGLWIEMKKRKNGRVSPEQKEWLSALEQQGYVCVVAHGSDEACDAIWNYLESE